MTTRFLYENDELVAEYDPAGTLLRRYLHGSGSDDPVVWYEGSSATPATRRHIFADRQDSIVSTTDTNGTIIQINRYDEWGLPDASNAGRLGYTGQAWIPELGLWHYKARFYSPSLGRFMQTDPIGYEDGINWYAYVGNDPVNNTDSTGEAIDVIADVVFIAADVADISSNGLNLTNGISLGANIVGAVLPGVTGLGAGTRAVGKAIDKASESIVYVRRNPVTKCEYVGRCRVDQSARRQRDHNRKGGVQHEYTEVDRVPNSKVRAREQQEIDNRGGPRTKSNPNGTLENRRNEVRRPKPPPTPKPSPKPKPKSS